VIIIRSTADTGEGHSIRSSFQCS